MIVLNIYDSLHDPHEKRDNRTVTGWGHLLGTGFKMVLNILRPHHNSSNLNSDFGNLTLIYWRLGKRIVHLNKDLE